ncbi:MAG: hypothetical protein ACI4I7_04105 [Oscillospiraceae bacterium]
MKKIVSILIIFMMSMNFISCGYINTLKEKWMSDSSEDSGKSHHDLSDITAVSLSCGHMDRSYGYYFLLHRDNEKWLFDAECFTHDHEEETVFENREVSDEDMDMLFEILKQNDSITYAENYKQPKKSPFIVLDETTYGFGLTFSDGEQYSTRDWQKDLEDFFYRLAEKSD